MGEWLKPAVLKTVSGVTRSGVRIPLPCSLYFIYLQATVGSLEALCRRIGTWIAPSTPM
jgi:hypothetical protein